MANLNNPHGLRHLGTDLSGGPSQFRQFTKPASDANTIYRGDVVARANGGGISAGGITPGTTLLSGVVLDYGAANTLTTHQVCVSPLALYEAQANGANGVTAAQLGQNANLAIAAGSSLPPHLSGTMIDSSTVATTATLDVHLVDLYGDVNNAFGQYDRIEIVINKHRMNGGTAGV